MPAAAGLSSGSRLRRHNNREQRSRQSSSNSQAEHRGDRHSSSSHNASNSSNNHNHHHRHNNDRRPTMEPSSRPAMTHLMNEPLGGTRSSGVNSGDGNVGRSSVTALASALLSRSAGEQSFQDLSHLMNDSKPIHKKSAASNNNNNSNSATSPGRDFRRTAMMKSSRDMKSNRNNNSGGGGGGGGSQRNLRRSLDSQRKMFASLPSSASASERLTTESMPTLHENNSARIRLQSADRLDRSGSDLSALQDSIITNPELYLDRAAAAQGGEQREWSAGNPSSQQRRNHRLRSSAKTEEEEGEGSDEGKADGPLRRRESTESIDPDTLTIGGDDGDPPDRARSYKTDHPDHMPASFKTKETNENTATDESSPPAKEKGEWPSWLKEANRGRLLLGAAVNNPIVQNLILVLIVTNAAMMGVATAPSVKSNPDIMEKFEICDLVFLWIFTVESAAQLLYHGYKLFFDGPLVFDFFIVAMSWLLQGATVLRSFRILRSFRLLTRVQTLKQLMMALFSVLPKMRAIFMLLLLIYYIAAVMFTQLFKDMEKEGLVDMSYFNTLYHSMFTLFQMMTLDNYSDIMEQVMATYPWAWMPFFGFIIITAFVVVNLIIAVICDAVHVLSNKSDLHGYSQGYSEEICSEFESNAEEGDENDDDVAARKMESSRRAQLRIEELQRQLSEVVQLQDLMRIKIEELVEQLGKSRARDVRKSPWSREPQRQSRESQMPPPESIPDGRRVSQKPPPESIPDGRIALRRPPSINFPGEEVKHPPTNSPRVEVEPQLTDTSGEEVESPPTHLPGEEVKPSLTDASGAEVESAPTDLLEEEVKPPPTDFPVLEVEPPSKDILGVEVTLRPPDFPGEEDEPTPTDLLVR